MVVQVNKVNYLVTGANRGIGEEIVNQLAVVEHNLIIAGVRDPSSTSAKGLTKKFKNVMLVKIDSTVNSDAHRAAKQLQAAGINHIDTVIANAGTATDWKSAREVKPEDVERTMNVNVVGTLNLFQAFAPLLDNSDSPKFIVISSAIASMGYQRNLPFLSTSYGASKAAINFVTLRIAIENENILTLALHPGLVKTTMAQGAQESLGLGMEEAITTEASVKGILELTREATLQSHSGKFFNATDGTELPW